MIIHSVFDAAFAPYGKVLGGYDRSEEHTSELQSQR